MVREISTTSDREVITRKTNNAALPTPCFVIVKSSIQTFKCRSGSPGLKELNNAGMAIKREKIGMNIHVLFKKKKIFILENPASRRQEKYRDNNAGMLLEKAANRSKAKNVISFIRG